MKIIGQITSEILSNELNFSIASEEARRKWLILFNKHINNHPIVNRNELIEFLICNKKINNFYKDLIIFKQKYKDQLKIN